MGATRLRGVLHVTSRRIVAARYAVCNPFGKIEATNLPTIDRTHSDLLQTFEQTK
ncbi:MAG: hypothetical protein QOJ49_282 [Actinomycetota bacterium]|jgi:hypothetical protein|nr:hypothetical protein [Actinomycetota bacterium]